MTNIQQWRSSAGLERLDCDVLLAHALGCDRAAIIAHPERPLSKPVLRLLDEWRQRRIGGEPVAYILETKEFWGLDFTVTPDVLVPRPDTEVLVERALANLAPGARVLELGTGCGAIAIAIAHTAPGCSVTAVDISPAALAVAHSNGEKHGVQVTWLESNWFDGVQGRFDVILSNPPYVAEHDHHLNALAGEPRLALVAGKEGLDALRQIIGKTRRHLAPNGRLLLEHGYEQGPAVRHLLAGAKFTRIESVPDLAGHERVSTAVRAP